MYKHVLTSLVLMLVSDLPARANGDPAFGLWLTEDERAIIEIAACDGMACGRIVWMDQPRHEDGRPKVDANNPDEALKSRTICGIHLIGNFKQKQPGVWDDGFVYNPKDGQKYAAKIKSTAIDKLELRGYVLVPAFGQSQTWTRVSDTRGGC